MKIYVLTAIAALALPFMTLGQTTKDEQQTTTQEQTKETQTTAPAKGKKMRPARSIPFIAKPTACNSAASNFACAVVSSTSGGRTLAHSGSLA